MPVFGPQHAVGRRRSGDRRCYGARAYAIHGGIDLSREDLGPTVFAVLAGLLSAVALFAADVAELAPHAFPVAAELAPSGQNGRVYPARTSIRAVCPFWRFWRAVESVSCTGSMELRGSTPTPHVLVFDKSVKLNDSH